MAEAEAAYAHLVDVLERSVVHVKSVLASCLLGLLKLRDCCRQHQLQPWLCRPYMCPQAMFV